MYNSLTDSKYIDRNDNRSQIQNFENNDDK